MSTAWHKALRDLWRERTRSLLVVLATAIGIAGFGSVLSTYAILTRELNAGYLATNPASATLKTDAVDAELLAALESGHGVAAAEARGVVAAQIKAGPAKWRNLQLFVVEDFANIRVSKLLPEQGAWPPAPGEILIERDALQVARARIGDTVRIKTANGAERALRLSGSVHDVGQAQARMEQIVYGYVTRDTLVEFGEQPYLDQLKIVIADQPFDEAHVRAVAADVESWLKSQGHSVRKVEVPTPGKHPHAEIMGVLLLIQASFGFFVLGLSGILIVNLLTALMAAQVRQIGVMKTVGGTRAQIASIYLGQAAALGLAAFVVALPLSIAGARALCSYMAAFLNFDIHSFAAPAWVYLLEVAVGVVVPLLAAAYPVWKASGISIRAALTDFEVSRTSFGTSAFDRALAGMGGLARPLALAVRNGFRRRTRTALTVTTLAIGGLFFMSALNLRASLVRTLDGLFGTMKYDLTVTLATMYPFEQVERALHDTPGVRQAEGWITSEGSLPGADGAALEAQQVGHDGDASSGRRFSVIGVPADTALLKPNTIAGRALQAGDTKVVVVNTTLASMEPRIAVGRDVELRIGPAVESWRVVGIAREPFAGPVAYVPRSYFENAGHAGMVNSLRLVLESTQPDFLDALATDLDRNLEQQGVRASSTATKADRRRSFDEHMLMIYVFLVVMSGLIASVGGLGLMTTMSLNVLERRREMGVLRAIGAAPSVVGLIVVAEALVLAFASWALAALAAWPVSMILGDLVVATLLKTGLDFVFEPLGLVVWLAVSLSLAVIASLVPAWRAARRPVREALAAE